MSKREPWRGPCVDDGDSLAPRYEWTNLQAISFLGSVLRVRHVNSGSRISHATRALAVGLVVSLAAPASALADAVALLPVDGRADPERLQEVEQLLGEILTEQGHRVVPPSESSVGHPPTSAQLESIATGSGAIYVVAAEVEPLRAQYRLHVHVYYRPAGRMEELVATVLEAAERERLSDILSAMVRRQGLGEDALRLTGEPSAADEPATDPAEQARLEEEERRRREEAEAREREEAERRRQEEADAAEAARREEEERRRAQEAWDARARYGTDAPWMAQLRVGGRYALALGDLPSGVQGGGGLFDLGIRLGRTFEGIEGFELRGGLDFQTGAFTSLGVHAGAAWLGNFFLEPVFIGLGGEVGVIFTLTGAREVGFSGSISALFAWRPTDRFYLEASLPEVGVVTPGTGAVTIGGSLRAGYRF